MEYITVSNATRVLAGIDYDSVTELRGDVYKKPLFFFNKRENNLLLALKELYKDPENFVKEYYKPIENKDSFRYIHEGGKPAYHTDDKCIRLLSNFKNFEVPEAIREQGKDKVIEFREWFKTVQNYFNDNLEIFEIKLFDEYKIRINIKAINYSNSGMEEKKNYNLPELESEIEKIIKDAGSFFKEQDTLHQNVIRRFSKHTFLAYSYKEIYSNDTGLSDVELKAFLRSYDITFKQPIKHLLREYYRVLHNPDLKFEGQLLEILGFKSCATCHNQTITFNSLFEEKPSIQISTIDELPF